MTNKHLLCFIDGIGERDRFDRLLERLGRDGWQAHLVSGVNEHARLPRQPRCRIRRLSGKFSV